MGFKRNLGDRAPPTGSPGETQFGGPGEGFREGLLVVGRLWRHGLEVGRLDVGDWLGVWDGVVGGWQTLEAWSGGLAGWRIGDTCSRRSARGRRIKISRCILRSVPG